MIFSSVKTLADAQRILDRVAHPAAAVLIDALHRQRSGGTPAEVAAMPPDRVPYGQVCDGPFQPVRPTEEMALTEARTGRLVPGDGEMPLRELIDALPPNASLAVESPVADLAGAPPDEVARLAYAALTDLLASTRPTGPVAHS